MNRPYGGDGLQQPYGSGDIARLVGEAGYRALTNFSSSLTQAPDVDARPPGFDLLDGVKNLQSLYDPGPHLHPPTGVPGQGHTWDEMEDALQPYIVGVVEAAVRSVTNASGDSIAVIGAKGDAAGRLEKFRECIRAGRPAVSVSASGRLRRVLTLGDPRCGSLSILVWLPEYPMAAATVTTESVLTADCSSAYRLRIDTQEWEQLAADTQRPTPEPGIVIVPEELRHMDAGLRREYSDIVYVEETASAIIQAVLNHSASVAILVSDGVLNSAILLIAAAQGLAVRLHSSKGTPLKPWDVSKLIFKTVKNDDPFLTGHVIAHDEVSAGRLARAVGYEQRRDDQ